MRDYNERFAAVGLTAQQFIFLHELSSHRHQSASSLATRCGLDRASITSLTNLLEKKRLVKRTINKVDRRSVNIELTPRGSQLVGKITKIGRDFDLVLTRQIGQGSMKRFREYLDQLKL